MKTLVLLLTVVASVAPHRDRITFPGTRQGSRPYNRPRQPTGHGPDGKLDLEECSYLSPNNPTKFRKQYHFSWCHDGGVKYDWESANRYCYSLGNGWKGLSIDSERENYFVTDIIERHRLPYIWTSGKRLRNYKPPLNAATAWEWIATGELVGYTNWGNTGQLGLPQPDNNEGSNENCLGILNHFYEGDTTTWHDIGCHHTKPIICQRRAGYPQ